MLELDLLEVYLPMLRDIFLKSLWGETKSTETNGNLLKCRKSEGLSKAKLVGCCKANSDGVGPHNEAVQSQHVSVTDVSLYCRFTACYTYLIRPYKIIEYRTD